jgi:hypothetical protein
MTSPDSCRGPVLGCFSSYYGDAFIFACREEAGTPEGCTVLINMTVLRSWSITIWYPYFNESNRAFPWSNCAVNVPGGDPDEFYPGLRSYCAPIGKNAFVVMLMTDKTGVLVVDP